MNTTIYFFIYIAFFFIHDYTVLGQGNSIAGQVLNEDGQPVQGVKISLGNGFEISDQNGNFVAALEEGKDGFENIQLFKRGHALKNWESITDKDGSPFLKIHTRYIAFDLLGKAFDEYGKPLTNTDVVLRSADPAITAKTNNKGVFSMHIPSYVRVNKQSDFLIAGRKVIPEGIKFEEKGGILNLSLPIKMQKIIVFDDASERIPNLPININQQSFATDDNGELSTRLGDKKDNVFEAKDLEVQEVKYLPADQVIMVYMKQIEITEQNSIAEAEEGEDSEEDLLATKKTEDLVETYGKDFNYIINELELEKQLLIERSNQLRTEMEKVAAKMSSEEELSPAEKESLQSYMKQLEEQLIENDLAYEEAQLKTKEIIDKMKLAMMSKDSIFHVTEEKLEEVVHEKQLVEEELKRDIIIFSVVACSLVAILGVTLISSRRIKKQRNELAIVNERLHEAQEELLRNVDEINKQNREIKEQATNLSELNKEVTLKNKKMTDNIRYALTVQEAILPNQEYIATFFPDYFITYLPKDIVSGDFYWFAHIAAKGNEKAKTFIAAVDCTGHGVSGAFMSLIGCTLLNDVVNQRGIYRTDQILCELNVNVARQLKQKENASSDGMDVSLCCIEEAENGHYLLNYSGAKRPLFYYDHQKKAIKRLKADRKSVGGKHNLEYQFTRQEITLKKGDSIYMDSDGYTDQHNSERERFGSKRLYDLILEIAEKPMIEQQAILDKTLQEHKKDVEQRDDILLMGIRL